jgi:hypothetical protein
MPDKTRIGYESFDSLVGGIFFDSLRLQRTIESAPMTFTIAEHADYVLSGGIRIIFTAP